MFAAIQSAARILAVVLIFLVALFGSSGAWAQAYPSKPVKLFVGFPPGGGSDALARLVGGALTDKLGQQVIVDNKPGANTIVATQFVQSQPADGYTLLFVSASFAINPSLYKLTYDIQKDFNLAKDGKLKTLAVSTAKRVSGAPDIPTIAESGVPGYDVATWESIQAPAGTPPDVVAKLNAAIREVVSTNELRQKMINLGFEPDAMKSPAEAAQFVRNEMNKWGKVVKERNIKVE